MEDDITETSFNEFVNAAPSASTSLAHQINEYETSENRFEIVNLVQREKNIIIDESLVIFSFYSEIISLFLEILLLFEIV